MRESVRWLAVAGIGAALSASVGTSLAADPGAPCTGLDHARRRVVEHSFEGVDALRRYVLISRPVHQIGMAEVVESLDEWRAKAQCTKAAAADVSAPAPTAIAQARR